MLVGLEPADDAAVYRVSDDRAIVFTVDVITPIVDDPHTFGRIAATNSISDVYAMGGRPLMALNVACFSPKVPPEALRGILAGASEVGREAACPILGGHTVKDTEVKFGLAVVGEVHPDAILTNAGARAGDALILTKGLGTSALATALKRDRFDENDAWFASMIDGMTLSNGPAVEIARRHGVNGLTDVTGFGLSGHATEMAEASGVTLRLELDALPALPGARSLLHEGFTCGGSNANRRHAADRLVIASKRTEAEIELLFDPQTSGPMLISLPEAQAEAAVADLRAGGYPDAGRVGFVTARVGSLVEVD